MGQPFPPVPNVVKLQLQGTTPGEIWENVLHLNYSGSTPPNTTLVSFANTIAIAWSTHVAPLCPAPIHQTNTILTDLASNTGAQGVAANNTAGTRGDDIAPSNACMLVSYPSTLRFRGGHFRTYLQVGGVNDNQDGMNWHTAFVSEVQVNWQGFLQSFVGQTVAGTTLTQLVGVKQHGRYLPNTGHGGPNTPPYVLNTPIVVPLSISALVTHQQMASQKGRIGRRNK